MRRARLAAPCALLLSSLLSFPGGASAATYTLTPATDGTQNVTVYGDTTGEQFSVSIDPRPFASAGSDYDTDGLKFDVNNNIVEMTLLRGTISAAKKVSGVTYNSSSDFRVYYRGSDSTLVFEGEAGLSTLATWASGTSIATDLSLFKSSINDNFPLISAPEDVAINLAELLAVDPPTTMAGGWVAVIIIVALALTTIVPECIGCSIGAQALTCNC